jgi:hypothetical protein
MIVGAQRESNWHTACIIAFAVAIFCSLRLPMVLFSSGQMDEQWFAVPGYTVWKEGIPRIPFCPTRNRANFFENADRCLFALPPGLHYVQAPFFGIFPAGYATARLPSFIGGILGLVILGLLTRNILGFGFVWGMGLILMAMSRPMMFTGITARPDMLCCVCCWGAIACMWRWAGRDLSEENGIGWELIAAGVLGGLGLLFHPFAVVGCSQCVLWGTAQRGGWKVRLLRGLAIALPAAAMLCLWLPLIAMFPREFESQFTSNVLERSGPGLLSRLIWPWESLLHHARYQWEYNQPIQFVFLSVGGLLGLVSLWFSREVYHEVFRFRWRIAILVISSVYLTATVAGIHPTKGYWVYAIGWLYPVALLGWSLAGRGAVRILGYRHEGSPSVGLRWGGGLLLIALMIPGSGMRTLLGYARDKDGSRTHAARFAAQMLRDIPSDARCIADVHFVFDVWLSGRQTLLCQPRTRFWGETYPEFDFLIVGQEGVDMGAPADYRAHLWRTFGEPSTPADCYVKIYTPSKDSDP